MNRKELSQQYWNYYLMLENRFLISADYVELECDNFDTFSNEYALLLQSIGSELDTFFKIFCGFNPTDRKSINDYANEILQTSPEIVNYIIKLISYDIEIQPYKLWNTAQPAKSLSWWEAFTDLKHNRYNNRKKATLEHVINCLGALFLVEMMHLKRITSGTSEFDVFDYPSKLFQIQNWTSKAISMGNGLIAVTE